MHENIKKDCKFVFQSSKYKDSIYNLNLTDNFFLLQDQKAKEYFFVIDNTEYPEALSDPTWVAP